MRTFRVQMTPPISLKDFEDFLCFRTKSAENLYFVIWLRAYTQLYNASTPANRPHQDVLALSASYKVAVETFFSARSPLELNVPSDIRRQLDGHIDDVAREAALTPTAENFLPPAVFEQAHHIASESLALSFKSFLHQASRNADRNRGRFAIFLGALTWALGLIPTSTFHLVRGGVGSSPSLTSALILQSSALSWTSLAAGAALVYLFGGLVLSC